MAERRIERSSQLLHTLLPNLALNRILKLPKLVFENLAPQSTLDNLSQVFMGFTLLGLPEDATQKLQIPTIPSSHKQYTYLSRCYFDQETDRLIR